MLNIYFFFLHEVPLGILAGFVNVLFLVSVAVSMVIGSVERLLTPGPILYREVMLVASCRPDHQYRLRRHPQPCAGSSRSWRT
jgi:hypothetical protein